MTKTPLSYVFFLDEYPQTVFKSFSLFLNFRYYKVDQNREKDKICMMSHLGTYVGKATTSDGKGRECYLPANDCILSTFHKKVLV